MTKQISTNSMMMMKIAKKNNNVPGGDVWPADSGRIPDPAAGLY